MMTYCSGYMCTVLYTVLIDGKVEIKCPRRWHQTSDSILLITPQKGERLWCNRGLYVIPSHLSSAEQNRNIMVIPHIRQKSHCENKLQHLLHNKIFAAQNVLCYTVGVVGYTTVDECSQKFCLWVRARLLFGKTIIKKDFGGEEAKIPT